jgi:spore maturation protein CgeB
MHGVDETRAFSAPHITNRKPVFDKHEVANIFHASAINLNITSLQFDTAMINRVIDCVAAGGFILTDRKAQLSELSSCAEEIGYSSVDELNAKIDFYLDPANREKKKAIVAQMSEEFAAQCSVAKTIERILEKVQV